MLNENAVVGAQYLCRNTIHRETEAAEAPMHDYKVAVGNDWSGFVLQGRQLLESLLERTQVEVECPGTRILMGEVPVGFCNRFRLEKVVVCQRRL